MLQRKCDCGQHTIAGGGCSDCEKKKGTLQRRASNSEATSEVPPIVHDVLRSPGQPLDATTRAFMEPRFGHDFSRVRVHSDSRAAESAPAVNALAYTVGSHVVFGAGQYAPQSALGKKLLAHELTHVVQQRSGIHLENDVGKPGDAYEQHADAVADRVVLGLKAEPLLDQMAGSAAGRSTNATGTGVMQKAGSGVQVQQEPKPETREKFPEIPGFREMITKSISTDKIKSPMMRALAKEYVNRPGRPTIPSVSTLQATPYVSDRVHAGIDELTEEGVFEALMSATDLKKTGKGDKPVDWSFQWIDEPEVHEDKTLGEQSAEVLTFGGEQAASKAIEKKYAAPDAGKYAIERKYLTKQLTWSGYQKALGNLKVVGAKSLMTGEISGSSVVEAISEPVARWVMKNVLKVSAEVITKTIPIIGWIWLAYDVVELLISLNTPGDKELSPSESKRARMVAGVKAYLEGKAAAAEAAPKEPFDPNKYIKPLSSDRFPMPGNPVIQRKAAPGSNPRWQSPPTKSPGIQTRLSVSKPYNHFEHEPERVAG